ncbi:uncharacterized protein BDV17DRAFT_294479 [Aspergillus undulatus]|uniref:uncharacterized protein n=1 Tax=Aspergillus undulatus TaxID=1810928 RepID=UPI003CCCB1A5
MAEELKHEERDTVTLLALHPGEVASDMGMIEISWDLDGGQITAEESVVKMIEVIHTEQGY